jgi:hypothetical protein
LTGSPPTLTASGGWLPPLSMLCGVAAVKAVCVVNAEKVIASVTSAQV